MSIIPKEIIISKWQNLFDEIVHDGGMVFLHNLFSRYEEKHRFYHNLSHIESMILLLEENKFKIKDYNSVFLAILYHDVIYNTQEKNNEIKSAELAQEDLSLLNYPQEKIDKVKLMIHSTIKHEDLLNDLDNQFFLDFDLSILFSQNYIDYRNAIRKEYSFVDEVSYQKGRIEVLNKFLAKPRIYFTEEFKKKEYLARENLLKEIEFLKMFFIKSI